MNIIQNLGAWFSAFPAQMRLVEWTDVLDMVVLALAYFWIYRFIRDRRGGRLIIGIGALFVVFLGAVVLRLHAMEFILRSLFQIGLLALLMLFQPEVRSALERLSAQPLRLSRRFRSKSRDHKLIEETVEEICNTAGDLSRKKTGALAFGKFCVLNFKTAGGTAADSIAVACYPLHSLGDLSACRLCRMENNSVRFAGQSNIQKLLVLLLKAISEISFSVGSFTVLFNNIGDLRG